MPGRSKKAGSSQPTLDELIPLSKAAEMSGLTPGRWRQLFQSGEVWSKKLGRDWFTTSQAVREYLARNRRPGPKRKSTT